MAKPKLTRTKKRIIFGDFQTPPALAERACEVLRQHAFQPMSVVEPTCGKGNLVVASLKSFPTISQMFGLDINPRYVQMTQEQIATVQTKANVNIVQGDFFTFDWKATLDSFPDPLLVIGNPPWVTNAALGRMGSSNLPEKTNFKKQRGIDALTGKSNFDISEWMLLRMCDWIDRRKACLAMICKTSVARKVLCHCWSNGISLHSASIYRIDSAQYFGASVEACLLILHASPTGCVLECADYATFADTKPAVVLGFREGEVIADASRHDAFRHLQGRNTVKWRSGVKHDCAKVFEFHQEGKSFRNGLGELVQLEPNYLFPMLKSSDLANGVEKPSRWLLVPQTNMGEQTSLLEQKAPKTWKYLLEHKSLLDKRGSNIYKGRPQFSIFGVGDYTFSPWKVAISGFYKSLHFRLVGPYDSKPVVFDDTCYFLACAKQQQAEVIAEILNSSMAAGFFSAFVFWDAKRPITAQLLQRLDLIALGRHLGLDETKMEHLCAAERTLHQPKSGSITHGLLPF